MRAYLNCTLDHESDTNFIEFDAPCRIALSDVFTTRCEKNDRLPTINVDLTIGTGKQAIPLKASVGYLIRPSDHRHPSSCGSRPTFADSSMHNAVGPLNFAVGCSESSASRTIEIALLIPFPSSTGR